MGTLEAPQDPHGQDTGWGPPEKNRQMEAKAGGLRGLNLGLLCSAQNQKIFHGAARGYQEPSGAKYTGQDRTGQSTGLDKPDRTGQPTGIGTPPGLGLEAEASSGHDEESGALAGSLSYRFHFPTAPDESPWT